MRKFLFIIPLFLWTCGGGGGSSPTEPEPPQLPTVQNINLEATEDTPKTFTFVGTEPNSLSLTYSISTQPQNGSISISGGSGTYTPNANYNGQDTFLYIATSTSGNSNIGTVLVNIAAVDDEPNTMDVSVTTDEDNVVTMTLEAEEVDGQTIQFNVTGNPSNGSVSISGTTATYTPNQDWFGTDTFNFEAVDSSSRSILNSATGTIVVNPINDVPTVENIDDIEVFKNKSIDITLNGTDIENDNLTYSIVDNPSLGSVSISGNVATFNATETGSDTFTYKASDSQGDSGTGTVSITISFEEKTFGGSSSDSAYDSSIISDDGLIIVGSGWSSISDIYRIDTDGNLVWEVDLGKQIKSVKETSDGGFILFTQDLKIIKMDSNGNEEWVKVPSSSLNRSDGQIHTTSDNGFILASSSGPIASADYDLHLVKLDEQGNSEWEKSWDKGGTWEKGRSVKQTSDGGFILSGSINSFRDTHIIKTDNQGNTEWEKTITGHSNSDLQLSSDGGYVFSGYNDNSSNNFASLIKTDSSGNELWIQTYETVNGLSGFQGIVSFVETDDNGFMLLGSNISDGIQDDIYLIKVDSSGTPLWYKLFGGSDNDYSYGSISKTSDNKYFLTADTHSYGSGDHDIWVLKVDSEGNRIF